MTIITHINDATVVAEFDGVLPYYRNQVQDSRGRWRDVAPEYLSLEEAMQAARTHSLREGKKTRVLYFKTPKTV
jgi:hypothetical protein